MTSSKVGRNFQKLIIKLTNAPVLDEVLFLQKTLIESIGKMQKAILESSRAVMKWGNSETNFTFSDVLSNWFDLDNALWLLLQDLQGECVKYRQVYKGIKEEERIMYEIGRRKESKANDVHRLKLKVNALRKSGNKKIDRLETLEAELTLAEQEVKQLDEELNAFVAEFEKSKARLIKDGLDVYSQGWLTFARKSLEIFTAQSQIAEEMPSKPVIFEDQITEANQMLVTKTFQKLNLEKPDHDVKPDREIKVETSPQPRKSSLDLPQVHGDDQHKQNIFSSIGNNLGAKLSKLSHKTSKECLSEDPPINAKSSISRPLPEVPLHNLDEESDDEDDNDDDDEYSMLNNEKLDDENYVVPDMSTSHECGAPQYTFLKQEAVDQPRYPPGFTKKMQERRLPPGPSYPSVDSSTNDDSFEDDSYLAVMSDVSDDGTIDHDLIYEDLHPALPPPRPPKNNSSAKPEVPAGYSSTNVLVLPPGPTFPLKKTSPKQGRKQVSHESPHYPDHSEPGTGTVAKPKVSPRPKRQPPTLPPPTLPPPTLPPTLPPKTGVKAYHY